MNKEAQQGREGPDESKKQQGGRGLKNSHINPLTAKYAAGQRSVCRTDYSDEFLPHIGAVYLNGSWADRKTVGDFSAGVSLNCHIQYFPLMSGSIRPSISLWLSLSRPSERRHSFGFPTVTRRHPRQEHKGCCTRLPPRNCREPERKCRLSEGLERDNQRLRLGLMLPDINGKY